MAGSNGVDPRVAKARRILNSGLSQGEQASASAPNRATGTRSQYKHGFLAAKAALAALKEKV